MAAPTQAAAEGAQASTESRPPSRTGPEARASRRTRRRETTREEILAAAREILLESGFEGVTLREVARRSEFSPAALYTYFASRDAIVSTLIADALRHLDEHLRRVPIELPPDERVVQLGLAYMTFARENPADLRCVLSATPESLGAGGGRALGLGLARLIGQTFREGVEQGVFRPSEGQTAAEMAYGVWALVHGMVSLSGVDLGEVAEDVGASPRRVLEAHVAGLKAGGERASARS